MKLEHTHTHKWQQKEPRRDSARIVVMPSGSPAPNGHITPGMREFIDTVIVPVLLERFLREQASSAASR